MPTQTLRALGAVATVMTLASGCSSPATAPTESSTTSNTAGQAPTSGAPSTEPTVSSPSVAPGEVGVSPGGVTTAVGAPADSTEDDYFQACRAARTWMDQQGGDPATQIEPYLKTIQSAESVGPGTFDKKWSELSPGQQSAVIVAVDAAADALCS